jgi:hypothetical protein
VDTISEPASKVARITHMRLLVEQLKKLEDRLRAGGGEAKIERQHRAGKMAARERIAALLDPGTPFLEIGLLPAYDQYEGEAPGLGSVTGIGKIEGRYAVIIAGDATVKAGSWWAETVTKACARRKSPCATASPSSIWWTPRASTCRTRTGSPPTGRPTPYPGREDNMAGTIKRTKSGTTPSASDSAPAQRLEVRRVSPGQMRQALALLGLLDEGKALPVGRFALIELSRDKKRGRVRRIFKTQAAEPPLRAEELRGPVRKAEIIAHATEALDGQVDAMQWLQQPNRSLGGRTPLEVLTEDAAEETERVDELLYGIEYGMFA